MNEVILREYAKLVKQDPAIINEIADRFSYKDAQSLTYYLKNDDRYKLMHIYRSGKSKQHIWKGYRIGVIHIIELESLFNGEHGSTLSPRGKSKQPGYTYHIQDRYHHDRWGFIQGPIEYDKAATIAKGHNSGFTLILKVQKTGVWEDLRK